MTTRTVLLAADRLVRQPPGADRRLLDNVSVTVHGGDQLAAVGPTGSGKTLLLRALAMLDPLDSGQLRWLGKPIAARDTPAYRSHVAYLSQHPTLFPGTVEDNLRFPFSLRAHRSLQFNRESMLANLQSLGRDRTFLEQDTAQLSGGEKQLVAMLRAMQMQPQILLLDEPTAALDQQARLIAEGLVASWFARQPAQRAFIWVTHDPSQAERISDRILPLAAGRLVDQQV